MVATRRGAQTNVEDAAEPPIASSTRSTRTKRAVGKTLLGEQKGTATKTASAPPRARKTLRSTHIIDKDDDLRATPKVNSSSHALAQTETTSSTARRGARQGSLRKRKLEGDEGSEEDAHGKVGETNGVNEPPRKKRSAKGETLRTKTDVSEQHGAPTGSARMRRAATKHQQYTEDESGASQKVDSRAKQTRTTRGSAQAAASTSQATPRRTRAQVKAAEELPPTTLEKKTSKSRTIQAKAKTQSRAIRKTPAGSQQPTSQAIDGHAAASDADNVGDSIHAKSPNVARHTGRADSLRPSTPQSESIMSSRSTTPSSSGAPVFEQPKDLTEDEADARDAYESSEESDDNEQTYEIPTRVKHVEPPSEDELAGPKTPMRRSRTTTARRKPAKAMVTMAKRTRPKRRVMPDYKTDSAAEQLKTDLADACAPEASMAHADDELAIDASNSLPTVNQEEDHADNSLFAEEDLFPEIPLEPIEQQARLDLSDLTVEAMDRPEEDINETILVEDDQDDDVFKTSEARVLLLDIPGVEELEHDEGIDHTAATQVEDDEDEDEDYTHFTLNPKTPRPQTIDWRHVDPSTTVRNALALRSSPAIDQSQLGILPDVVLSSPTKRDIAAEVAKELEGDGVDDVDQTIEFTEFVTMSGAIDATPSQPFLPNADMETTKDDAGDRWADRSAVQQSSFPTRDESPHYMRPTIAFDARRKTLPAKMRTTPAKSPFRPFTADGGSSLSATRPKLDSWKRYVPQSPIRRSAASTTSTPAVSSRSLAPFSISGPRVMKAIGTPQSLSKHISLSPTRQHAPHTVAGYTRYRNAATGSPTRTAKASTMRDSLRRMALRLETDAIRTPTRTPLRSITGAPGIVAMTPHPLVPLKGVTAIVEIYTCEGAFASAPFIATLHRLGAKTTKIWSERVTHVVYKDGSPTTLQRIATHNRRVERGQIPGGHLVYCVNSRWVSDCDTQSTRVSETDEAYAVRTEAQQLYGSAKRKRKSMEPMQLLNVDGSLVRNRTSSYGRSSSGRLGLSNALSQTGSPAPRASSVLSQMAAERSAVQRDARQSASPATPTWIAAPSRLMVTTAPVKRIRMLETVGGIKLSGRRITASHDGQG